MRTKLPLRSLVGLGLCLLPAACSLPVLAQGTAFTYQGRLDSSGSPANGLYDLTFALFSVASGTGQVGSTITTSATPVTNGLFTVTLDFGPGLFAGAARWLEISVRTNGGSTFTTLVPRQDLTPDPYAVFANTASNLSGSLPANQLSGTIGNNQLANNSLTVNAGTGLSGGGTVALGGALTLNNAGVLSVAGNPDITVSTIGGAVTLGDTATDADSPGLIVKRDPAGNFSAGTLTLNGNLDLSSATPSSGIIYSGGNTLLYTLGTANFFAGPAAGNLGVLGFDNTASGATALAADIGGSFNTATGSRALMSNTSGADNTATGGQSLQNNTIGDDNTAEGFAALFSNSSGINNTAAGSLALSSNTIGSNNTANGSQALRYNTANDNTAAGFQALLQNSTGSNNTASGSQALSSNTSGSFNAAFGYQALFSNAGGGGNTASGSYALYGNNNGTYNTADGYQALSSNASGSQNTAEGFETLFHNTTGSLNTAGGTSALFGNTVGNYNAAYGADALSSNTTGSGNTAGGYAALYSNSSGSNNIALGFQAGAAISTGSYNIEIGNTGTGTDNNTIRIGSGQTQTFLAGVFGTAVSGGSAVYVNSLGQLGTASDVESVALLGAGQTFSGANTFNGAVTLGSTVNFQGNTYLNDHDLQLRNDTLHGVGWYGLPTKTFAGLNVNGPALYGNSGGVLGTKGPTSTNAALAWDSTGRITVDPLGANSGNLLPGITFGLYASGEGIASQRSAGVGVNGLDFYTGNTLRLRIVNDGFVGIGTNNPQQALHVVGNIVATGTVTGSSDRNAKERFTPVNPREVLEKVSELPISRWNYKNESEVTHLGPMAQDFYTAFEVGLDDKHISMVDADGVALAAIQGLNQKLAEELKRRDAENAQLRQRLETLEKLMNLSREDSK